MDLQDFLSAELAAIRSTLSLRLLQQYQRDDAEYAIQLFVWNLRISRAFYAPCHLAEVVLRNIAVNRLEERFGAAWHSGNEFVQTLPVRLRQELEFACRETTPTKSISDRLSLGFWCHIFSWVYRDLLWHNQLQVVFPYMPFSVKPQGGLLELHRRLQKFRMFRNKVFHHEPIYHQSPTAEFQNIDCLVGWRCKETQLLLRRLSDVSRVINQRPRPKPERS